MRSCGNTIKFYDAIRKRRACNNSALNAFICPDSFRPTPCSAQSESGICQHRTAEHKRNAATLAPHKRDGTALLACCNHSTPFDSVSACSSRSNDTRCTFSLSSKCQQKRPKPWTWQSGDESYIRTPGLSWMVHCCTDRCDSGMPLL